jgi:hypothetical protein
MRLHEKIDLLQLKASSNWRPWRLPKLMADLSVKLHAQNCILLRISRLL